MITYQIEKMSEVHEDMEMCLHLHYAEISTHKEIKKTSLREMEVVSKHDIKIIYMYVCTYITEQSREWGLHVLHPRSY